MAKSESNSLIAALKSMPRGHSGTKTFYEKLDPKKQKQFKAAIDYLRAKPEDDRPFHKDIIAAIKAELGIAPSETTLTKLLRGGCE